MRTKIVSWNVRGLNDMEKRKLVKQLVHQWGKNIYVLIETKVEGDVNNIVICSFDDLTNTGTL